MQPHEPPLVNPSFTLSPNHHLVRPRDPLEAALEDVVVVGDGLRDVGRAGLVERRVDRVRDAPLRPDEERVVAEAVSGGGKVYGCCGCTIRLYVLFSKTKLL